MKHWIKKVSEYAPTITEEQFNNLVYEAKKQGRLWCRQCGTCCIVPTLREVNKPANVRCQYLTEDNLCSIHENKPYWCGKFPYIDRYDWMTTGMLGGSIKGSIEFCRIVEAFWSYVYETKILKNINGGLKNV